MVLGIGSSDSLQVMLQQLYSKADTDGTKGISKNELSALTQSDNTENSEFLKSLEEQFDGLDNDQDGELSNDELSSYAKPTLGQIGTPAGLDLGSDFSSGEDGKDSNSFSSLIDSLMNKIINKLDENGDGIVTQEEIENTLTQKSAGSADSETAGSTASSNTDSNKLESTVKNLAGSFIEKIIAGYQKGGFDNLASSIGNFV